MAKIRLMKSDELEKTLQELYEDFQLQKFIRNDNTIYEQSLVHFFRFMKKIGVEFVV
ncbi:hypothetical protein ABWK46_23895 [Peribacillus frigoritolerans]|uniref:hypothetical protein n=1 Tax=Peribacillus frigoritolerans TaxID=450367 RepID=UPI003395CEE6